MPRRKVHAMETRQKEKRTLRRLTNLGQKIIFYRVLQFCKEYWENKELINYLKRANEGAQKRSIKVIGRCRDFANEGKVGENLRRPEKC